MGEPANDMCRITGAMAAGEGALGAAAGEGARGGESRVGVRHQGDDARNGAVRAVLQGGQLRGGVGVMAARCG